MPTIINIVYISQRSTIPQSLFIFHKDLQSLNHCLYFTKIYNPSIIVYISQRSTIPQSLFIFHKVLQSLNPLSTLFIFHKDLQSLNHCLYFTKIYNPSIIVYISQNSTIPQSIINIVYISQRSTIPQSLFIFHKDLQSLNHCLYFTKIYNPSIIVYISQRSTIPQSLFIFHKVLQSLNPLSTLFMFHKDLQSLNHCLYFTKIYNPSIIVYISQSSTIPQSIINIVYISQRSTIPQSLFIFHKDLQSLNPLSTSFIIHNDLTIS